MSALDDFAQKTLGLNKDQVSALQSVETVIGMVPMISGYISTGKTILEALGILQAPVDPLQQAVKQLTDAFNAAFQTADIHTLMLEVGAVMGYSDTSMQLLGEQTSDQLRALRDNPNSSDFVTLDTESGYPVNTLQGSDSDGYWQRFFFQGGVFPDPLADEELKYWAYQPPVSGGLVFDYRLTLPAYLRALTVRLTVAAAIFKDFATNPGLKSQFAQSAQFLREKFKPIQGGIREVPLGEGFFLPLDTAQWAQFGAVEVYSTFHVLDEWPSTERNSMGLSVYDWYPKYMTRNTIRKMARWKSVYSQIGLPKLAATIAHLEFLANGSPTPIDGPTNDWSLRELAGRLNGLRGLVFGVDVNNIPPNSWFTLPADKTVGLKAVLHALQTFNALPYTSLRAALAQ